MNVRRAALVAIAPLVVLGGCRGLLSLEEKVLVDADASDDDGASSDAGTEAQDADACSNNETTCTGGCTSLLVDRANCGRCGRSCGSVACVAGRCDPRYIANVGDLVYGLADGQSYIYWTSDAFAGGRLFRVSKLGGPVDTVDSPGAAPTGVVVVAPDDVYVASQFGGTIKHLLGGNPNPLVTGQDKAAGIAIEADAIYFTRYSFSGDIRRIPREGGSATVIVPNVYNPLGIATDATHIYYTTHNVPEPAPAPGLWRAEKDGGALTQILRAVIPQQFALDDDAVHSADRTAGVVVKIAKEGGAVTPIAMQKDVFAIATDVDSVYWVTGGGVVARAPKAGGPTTVLAGGQLAMGSFMIVDDTNVYWLASNMLFAVPK
jgi:hypothetical protein